MTVVRAAPPPPAGVIPMREPDVVDIEGVTYEIRPVPTTKGLALMALLTDVLGESLAAVVATGQDAAAKVIPQVLAKIDEAKLARVCQLFAAGTTVVQSPAFKPPLESVFDEHFAGRYKALFLWLRASFEVNFGPLFDSPEPPAAATPAQGGR